MTAALMRILPTGSSGWLGRYLAPRCVSTAFVRDDAAALKRDAVSVIGRYFPEAAALYARRGWQLPASIGRVYDASTDFAAVLDALRDDRPLPFAHDPAYTSPQLS